MARREYDWPPENGWPPEQRVRFERRRNNVLPLLFVALAVILALRFGFRPWIMLAALLGLLPN
jgi:hypothetical protein